MPNFTQWLQGDSASLDEPASWRKRMFLGRVLVLCGFLFCSLVSYANNPEKTASTREAQMTAGPYYKGDLMASYNSWGLVWIIEATFRRPMAYSDQLKMVWSHFELGGRYTGSPAATKLGLHGEWMPAAVFRFRVHYDYYLFHGGFGYLLTYEQPDEAHDEPDVYDRSGEESVAVGHRFWLQPTLRGAFKGWLFRNQSNILFYLMDTDAPYYLNWEYETLVKPEAFIFENRTELLFNFLHNRSPKIVYAGLFYAMVSAPETQFRRQRTGLALYTEPFRQTSFWGMPRFYAIAGYNLEERYRKNEVMILIGLGSTWNSH